MHKIHAKWILIDVRSSELSCVYMFATRKAARRMKTDPHERVVKALILVCGNTRKKA